MWYTLLGDRVFMIPEHHKERFYPFVVKEVRSSFRYRAMRWAVLDQLVRSASTPAGDIQARMDALRKRWQARIYGLAAVGWEAAGDRKKLTYLANCPPFGVKTDIVSRCCRRVRVCPFCYARDVVLEAFLHMELAMYGSLDHLVRTGETPTFREPLNPDLKLVSFSYRPKAAPVRKLLTPEVVRDECCPRVRRFVRCDRRLEVQGAAPVAAVVMHRVWLDNNTVRVSRGGVMLTTRTEQPAFLKKLYEAGEAAKWTVHEQHKKCLASAVSAAFPYPRAMLSSDPAATVAMIDALGDTRMFAKFGRVTNSGI